MVIILGQEINCLAFNYIVLGKELPGGRHNNRVRRVDKLLYSPRCLCGPDERSGVVPVPLCALAIDEHGGTWASVLTEAVAPTEEGK